MPDCRVKSDVTNNGPANIVFVVMELAEKVWNVVVLQQLSENSDGESAGNGAACPVISCYRINCAD